MIKTKWMGAFGIALLVAACGGGGGDAGTSPFVPGSNTGAAAVADISISLNKTAINNAGSDSVVATVTAVDANRVALDNVPVTVGADSGAVVVANDNTVGSSRVDLQACKLEYSIVSPK